MAELSAALGIFKPTDIILFVARSEKNGCLTFSSEGSKGRVFVKNGKVVHAELENWVGADALFTITSFDSGTVEFEFDSDTKEETIADELSELSEEFDRRRVEFEKFKEKLPTVDTILYKSPEPVDESLSLRRTDWQILALIDGKRNLGKVIKKSKLGLFDAMNSLDWLIDKGLVATTKIEIAKEKVEVEDQVAEEEIEEEEKVVADWSDKIYNLLNDFFAEFAGKGTLLRKWIDGVNRYDERVQNLFDADEQSYSIDRALISNIGNDWWNENVDDFLDHLKKEGIKIYGKILARKKWEKVEKKLADEGSE